MKNLITLLLVLPLVPVLAGAKSAFDGTWKLKLDSMKFEGKPDVFELSGGMYSCASCVPAYKIKSDGTDQPVPGHDYLDHQAVKVVSPTSVELTSKKSGKVMVKETLTLAADGKSYSSKFTSYVGDKPFDGSYSEKRVATGPAGAHALSGTWMQNSMDLADVARAVTLETSADGLKIVWNGQVTDAKFDGKEYPAVGDPGKTMVALKKMSDRQIEETDRRSGKVFDVIVWTVSADGKSITTVDTDPVHGTKVTSTYEK